MILLYKSINNNTNNTEIDKNITIELRFGTFTTFGTFIASTLTTNDSSCEFYQLTKQMAQSISSISSLSNTGENFNYEKWTPKC